ncbi:hypothetical protein, unlikely [Trypanosoma brucei gambiense DAL972]|uniref:Uncharacterized protein n=1 Tax=Trypanosoma brucei gambiense (strain MHOM/CI/86/DAL972) TaxID=679716 RepID=D0A598_TRYB9|nr:hypothetical protein, unlikely [Trypanosoma brucei gambiense DAL972]CBH16442.1 hypothetical protein, unlikely [Trypanosoma brucei gambiense DAL972]|eukprot:XP_011778706.1 hypothetical protein, unlikely [Trypanosoma brucei gambiense DAL972]
MIGTVCYYLLLLLLLIFFNLFIWIFLLFSHRCLRYLERLFISYSSSLACCLRFTSTRLSLILSSLPLQLRQINKKKKKRKKKRKKKKNATKPFAHLLSLSLLFF